MNRSNGLRMLLLLISTLTMNSALAQDWRLKTNLASGLQQHPISLQKPDYLTDCRWIYH